MHRGTVVSGGTANKHVLTLEAAKEVVAAAESKALERTWPGVIAVVDAEGYILTLDRMKRIPDVGIG